MNPRKRAALLAQDFFVWIARDYPHLLFSYGQVRFLTSLFEKFEREIVYAGARRILALNPHVSANVFVAMMPAHVGAVAGGAQ